MEQNNVRIPRRRGVSAIYVIVMMAALVGLSSLATDWGHVQLVKTQLRVAADAAARYGVTKIGDGIGTAQQAAITAAADNKSDGKPVVVTNADIEFGTWNTTSRTFTVLSGAARANANAMRVTAKRTKERGNATTLTWGSVIGQDTCDVIASATAMYIPPINVNQNVLATSNPFLAGMPNGSIASKTNPHNNPDYAPAASPTAIGMPIVGGQALTFDSIAGNAAHDPGLSAYNPDGNAGDIGHNNVTTSGSNSYGPTFYNENGIADVKAPINALVGVFLDDSTPTTTSTPENLDFSSESSRNFNSLSPKLKQIFFIGDGQNSSGGTQTFIAPTGATRLYLATWDFYEWNNNYGYRNIRINRPGQVMIVQ